MKKNFKKSLFFLFALILFAFAFVICPNQSYAGEAKNVTVSNLVVRDGFFSSFDVEFSVPDYFAKTTTCCLGMQAAPFDKGNQEIYDFGDLTDDGNVCKKGYKGINDVKRDDSFLSQYKICAFSDDEFQCFGDNTSIKTSFSNHDFGLYINNDTSTFYIYLWTTNYKYSEEEDAVISQFYPDSLIATVSLDENGNITINNPEGVELINDNINSFEAETINKIEIDNVNMSSIKVGEKPSFTGTVKDYSDLIELEQLFYSEGRESFISQTDIDTNSEDSLIENFKYIFSVDIKIKDNANYKFDENTEIIINGKSMKSCWQTDSIIRIEEDNLIIPEDYVEPAKLDESFEEEQIKRVNTQLLKALKEGKLKCKEEGFLTTLQNALANGQNISFEIFVSETIHKTTASHWFDDDKINSLNSKIKENQYFGAYYEIVIIAVIDGYYEGQISEIEEPIEITIPLPNGLPKINSGYERIWKVIRYHNGATDVLDAKLTENGISFMNDKYSEFALVYEDVKLNVPEENTNVEEKTNVEETIEPEVITKNEEVVEASNPKTGDSIMIWISLMVVSMLGIAGTVKFVKKSK